MRHRLWEKVRHQHKISTPSLWSAITHHSSKVLGAALTESEHLAAATNRQRCSSLCGITRANNGHDKARQG